MQSVRLSPNAVIAAVMLVWALGVGAAIRTAVETPRLGLTFGLDEASGAIRIVSVDPAGPAAAIEPGGQLLSVGDLTLEASDIVEDPDQFTTYPALDGFLERQGRIVRTLAEPPVSLAVREADGGVRRYLVRPGPATIGDLPGLFWLQVFAATGSLLVGGWVLALRRSDRAARLFALSSFGLFTAIMAAAVYSTRELALDGTTFRVLAAVNHFGANLSNGALVGLFLSYPQPLVGVRALAALGALVMGWFGLDAAHALPTPFYGGHGFLAVMLLLILAAIAAQWRATRSDPGGRAVVRWVGACVVFGAGAYALGISVPLLYGMEPLLRQAHSFLFLMMIYAGIAVGVGRYRLFQLGEWAFRIGFYTGAVLLLVALDVLLVFALGLAPAPSFGLAILAVGFGYLPARDFLWRRLVARRRLSDEELFRRVVEAALAATPPERAARWRDLLAALFDPLAIVETATVAGEPEVRDDGIELLVPGTAAAPSLLLRYPWSGRGLFGPSHVRLARQVTALAQEIEDRRAAYERGVSEERQRISRDLHDDVGARLLSCIHKPDLEQTRETLRAALADLRTAISGLAGEERALGDVLADLRHEAFERTEAAGLALDWPFLDDELAASLPLPYRIYGNLTSALRETISNAIRHARARTIAVRIEVATGRLRVRVTDDGIGLAASRGAAGPPGHGLASLRRRMEAIGGSLALADLGRGTCVLLELPLPAAEAPSAAPGRRAAE
jgi:signal transduction histidine kinase